MTSPDPSHVALESAHVAHTLIERAHALGATVATAESLTGGLLSATLVSVPGASSVVRGGVVAYATPLKHSLLGVDNDLLRDVGAVDPRVAVLMAEGARERCSVEGLAATVGIATTGVAGPREQDGHPVGEVFVAVATAGETRIEHLWLEGDRTSICAQTVHEALKLALAVLSEEI